MIDLGRLKEDIITFDWGYENSDSHATWEKWNYIEKSIAIRIEYLSGARIQELVESLDEYGKRVWERYFKNDI